MIVLFLLMIPWLCYGQSSVPANNIPPSPNSNPINQYGLIDPSFYQYLRRQSEINNAFIINNVLLSESVNAKIQKDAVKHLEDAYRQHNVLLQPSQTMNLTPQAVFAGAGSVQPQYPIQSPVPNSNPNDRLGIYDVLTHLAAEQQGQNSASEVDQTNPRPIATVESAQAQVSSVQPASSGSGATNVLPVLPAQSKTQTPSSPLPKPVFAGVTQYAPQQYEHKVTVYSTTIRPKTTKPEPIQVTSKVPRTRKNNFETSNMRIISSDDGNEFIEAFEEDSQRVTPAMDRIPDPEYFSRPPQIHAEPTPDFTATTQNLMMHDIFQHLNLSQTEARNLVERVEQIVREELAKKLAEKSLTNGDRNPKTSRINGTRKSKHHHKTVRIPSVINEVRNDTIRPITSENTTTTSTLPVTTTTTTILTSPKTSESTTTTTTAVPLPEIPKIIEMPIPIAQPPEADKPEIIPIIEPANLELEENERDRDRHQETFPIEIEELVPLSRPASESESVDSYDVIKEANKAPLAPPKLKKINIIPNQSTENEEKEQLEKLTQKEEGEPENPNEDDDLLPIGIATGAPLNLAEADALDTTTTTQLPFTTVTYGRLSVQTSPFMPRRKMHAMTEFERLASDYRQRLSNTGDINRLLRGLYENAYISLSEAKETPKSRVIRKKPRARARSRSINKKLPLAVIASSP